ncbi:MAG TPA: inositol monophosphatase family protein [Verrucomicrobiae bacterium]|nr:inositol monophosphatase family protein [Verrucomicrobiae bacterium]
MNKSELRKALAAAVRAAEAAGRLMRENLRATKKVNARTSHDIKLELDVRCQKRIEKSLRQAFPRISLLGEEGDSGSINEALRWVVDPIDGTVNFAYGIPHACVSIALQQRSDACQAASDAKPFRTRKSAPVTRHPSHVTILGVVHDPFTDETWTAIRGEPTRLNGHVASVSNRKQLQECIVCVGFAKSRHSLERALPQFIWMARRVRKMRMMGAAALGLAYVASGRFDAYVERGVSLWDVAAGGLLIECAGGKFWTEPVPGSEKIRMVASNGLIHHRIPQPR